MSEHNDYCGCGHRPANSRHVCGITFVAQEKRIAQLEAALRRLASPQAFEYSRTATTEETARMKFAQAALGSSVETGDKHGRD